MASWSSATIHIGWEYWNYEILVVQRYAGGHALLQKYTLPVLTYRSALLFPTLTFLLLLPLLLPLLLKSVLVYHS